MYSKVGKVLLRQQRSFTSSPSANNTTRQSNHHQHNQHPHNQQFGQSSSHALPSPFQHLRPYIAAAISDNTTTNATMDNPRAGSSIDGTSRLATTASASASEGVPPTATRESAAATMPSESAAATAQSEAPPMPTAHSHDAAGLLRDWSTGSNPPPVAPAVVLNETSDSSQSSSQQSKIYSYPVATYVSNFVRSSVNEIRNEIRDHLGVHVGHVMAIPEEHVSSIRSEPMAEAARSDGSVDNTSGAMDTVRSLNVLDEDLASNEFVLIDGDLISISSAPQHHLTRADRQSQHYHQHRNNHFFHGNNRFEHHQQQDDESHDDQRSMSSYTTQENCQHQAEMDFYQQQDRTSCRSSRMRRGVRGFKKWVGKKKRMIGKRVSSQRSLQRENSERSGLGSACGEETISFSGATAASSSSAHTSSIRREDDTSITTSGSHSMESPARGKKNHRKKKSRLPWLRDIEDHEPVSAATSTTASATTSSLPSQDRQLEQLQLQQLPQPPPPPSSPQRQQQEQPPPQTVLVPPQGHSSTQLAAVVEPALDGEASISYGLGSPDAHPYLHDAHPFHRSASIAAEASFVGNADTLYLEAGVLPDSVAAEAYIEDRLDDYDKYDDKKDGGFYPRSMVPANADFKVDKLEAPCVDSMLRRAGEFAREITTESEPSVTDSFKKAAFSSMGGKSDGESVPLSMATSKDSLVHNDVLKLVMVGAPNVDKAGIARALRKSHKKAKKRTTLAVDVHTWAPPNEDNVKFTIWDVQGANSTPYTANFGAHPGTQSLFFSDRSLYLLVWDLAADNRRTFRAGQYHDDNDEDSDSDDENEFFREEVNRQADRALQTDIEDRVLSWVDCIARRGPNSAILPVALVPQNMAADEAKRRCDIMQTLLMEHTDRKLPGDLVAPKVLSGVDTVICVNLETNMGMNQLEETILAIATDASHSVFDHVGTPVPDGVVSVLETVRRLKQNHKLVLVDHLMGENDHLSFEQVVEALHFLAGIGEVLYFGGMDEILSQYVILSRKWLVSALSCILRNDLKRELAETRRFMNMQCLYSDQQFPENHVTQTFSASHSTCPLLSSLDTQMLWQSMSFMREAADQTAQLSENSTTALTMFGFLQHLLVHTGVFLPLDIDRFASPDNVYFVPSLLAQADSSDVWTFKSSESWMTTLSHSWLFRDGTPVGLMERVTVALLRDLYEFSHIVARPQAGMPQRSSTFPLGHNGMNEFMETHDGEAVGHIKIHQMMCWKSSLLIKIGCVFSDGDELRESFVEVFVAITDQSSSHCVASDAMRANMQRLVVSGKGQVGHHGRKLWKGGYGIVLDSIKASVADCTNVDRQVVCPECLAKSYPSSASTWSWDSVRAAAESGSSIVRCMRGHRVDSNLICGSIKPALPKAEFGGHMSELPKKPVRELLPSVVVVGLWEPKTKTIVSVGSGYVADKKHGLIVTAAHIIFNMEEGRNFGVPFCGSKTAKAVIGVIPEGSNSNIAVFRYFAEIVAEDVHSVDACVLKITTRLEQDVDDDALVGEQPETVLNDPTEEQLQMLKMAKRYELEETVRILGFNQGGEGILERGKHVNRSADFAKGYICKQFKMSDDNSTNSSMDDSSSSSGMNGFSPREEIVIMCPTISGHSGGPCVNDEGRVVGILSRADSVDRQRCYLVPFSELKILVNKAKKHNSRRAAGLKMY